MGTAGPVLLPPCRVEPARCDWCRHPVGPERPLHRRDLGDLGSMTLCGLCNLEIAEALWSAFRRARRRS